MSRSGLVKGVEGEDFIEVLNVGDNVTLCHQWSKERRTVVFSAITEKIASINWNMCGEYEIDLKTGTLKGKKVKLWNVVPEDLKKIRASVQMESYKLHDRLKSNRG